MDLPPWMMGSINAQYNILAYADYPQFRDFLGEMRSDGAIDDEAHDNLLDSFPDPRPTSAPAWQNDEGTEVYLRNPPDLDPVSTLPFRNWMDDELAGSLSLDDDGLRGLLGFPDADVLNDIQANALRILDGCNDPRSNGENWGENRRGLVFGMVQSGKTANMLSLISLGLKAGYRLFILLAGDKTSLRDQTQSRVNSAFNLDGGVNSENKVHSPTFQSDFKQAVGGYTANFRYNQRVFRGDDKWTTIIVIKKETNHLNALVNQIEDMKHALQRDGLDMDHLMPAMIIDDEADYASQNTDVKGEGTTIHSDIVSLREVIPRNCYVAYTATPQANLSASIDDPVGYPRHFWWMIEPFMDRDENGIRRPRTYTGSWEVFWEYDSYLLNKMGRDEWPHHEKDSRGRPKGVYVPPRDSNHEGKFSSGLTGVENGFLEEIVSGQREVPQSLLDGMLDFMIGCGIRWWREWNQSASSEKPSTDEIRRSYAHHAMMVHLSLLRENQEVIRNIVQELWPKAVESFESFDPESSDDNHPFRSRWRKQMERSRALRRIHELPFGEIRYFIERCIEITQDPIYDHRAGSPYTFYPGKPWAYLLNSSDEGMELNYSKSTDWEVRAKKAAIIIGGNILSRGLTVEGLSVTVFARSAMDEKMDTVLQRGRWFGHKASQIDITSIFLQDEARVVFREIAEADRYLRLQIQQALHEGHTPLEVLVELRNSPFVSPTSASKSNYLEKNKGYAFSGKRALLNSPSFEISDIDHNIDIIEAFMGSHARERCHNRGFIARDVDPDTAIGLLQNLNCSKTASQVSFQIFADYLKDWRVRASNGEVPDLPGINIAVMDVANRQRKLNSNHIFSTDQAIAELGTKFGAIVGGRSGNGEYKGDAFFDKDLDWHLGTEDVGKVRKAGDDLLIVFYRLNPNYIRSSYWDRSQADEENPHGKLVRGDIEVPDRHDLWVPGETPVITFAAWTPEGGPMYSVGTNKLIDRKKIKQQGVNQLAEEEV